MGKEYNFEEIKKLAFEEYERCKIAFPDKTDEKT
ncbi:unnamed protein product, partial [marine sediment metagenome]